MAQFHKLNLCAQCPSFILQLFLGNSFWGSLHSCLYAIDHSCHFLLVKVFYPLTFLVIMNMSGLLLLLFYMIFIFLLFSFLNPFYYMNYVFFDFVSSSDLKVMFSVVIFLVVKFTFKNLLVTVLIIANAKNKTIFFGYLYKRLIS